MYLASEGRGVAVVSEEIYSDAIAALRSAGYTAASLAGQVENGVPSVVLETRIGGETLLPEPEDDPLPRIC